MSSECEAGASSLRGKVILITGASSGIGAGVSTHFATFGPRLALVARNTEALLEVRRNCLAAGAGDVITLSYDLAEEKNCELAVAETVKKFK